MSGGADSTALALLTRDWVRARHGTLLALIIDHGLRPESAAEARTVADRLRTLGIAARILPLTGLERGPALAERARIARYEALTRACAGANVLHLMLGHHAADQAETLAMRVLRDSRDDGLAATSAIVETPALRLLRPLLGIGPAALRRFLTDRGIDWVEDPSNQDRRALRPRLRAGFDGPPPAELTRAIACAGRRRTRQEADTAAALGRRAHIYPEGYALIECLTADTLAALVRAVGGAAYPPDPDRIAALALCPRAATLAGTRIMAAGRLGPGWLIVREEAAIAPCSAAMTDMMWDDRFRLRAIGGPVPVGMTIWKLGDDAARFRHASALPSAVLRTLPALRVGKILAAVPHLGYSLRQDDLSMTVMFTPPKPVSGGPFRAAQAGSG